MSITASCKSERIVDSYPSGTGDPDEAVIEFTYRSITGPMGFHSENEIILTRDEGRETYSVRLTSRSDWQGTEKTARFVRRVMMQWALERAKTREE